MYPAQGAPGNPEKSQAGILEKMANKSDGYSKSLNLCTVCGRSKMEAKGGDDECAFGKYTCHFPSYSSPWARQQRFLLSYL